MLDNDTFDALFAGTKFREEISTLRHLILKTGLTETVKWKGPVYVHNGQNVVGIAAFKEHFGLWFFQGALLKDPLRVLVNAQAGKTHAMRQWRMNAKADIQPRHVMSYLHEAITNAQKGKRIAPRKATKSPPPLPDTLKTALEKSTRLRTAFEKLTPGKQKEYAEYIATAKQTATQLSRITRIRPMILAGAGLNDRYKK